MEEPADAECPEAEEDYSPNVSIVYHNRTKAKKEKMMNRTLDELLGFPLRKKKSRAESNGKPGYASPQKRDRLSSTLEVGTSGVGQKIDKTKR